MKVGICYWYMIHTVGKLFRLANTELKVSNDNVDKLKLNIQCKSVNVKNSRHRNSNCIYKRIHRRRS